MKLGRILLAAMFTFAALFAFVPIQTEAKTAPFSHSSRTSQNPAEQDKRLEHLPGKLMEAVKTLRDWGYSTRVSQWAENDRGNGLSDGQLGLDGDAGYPYSDGGFSDCNHIDYYTLNYKRLVKDKKPSLSKVDDKDTENGLRHLFEPIAKELKPLIDNGYQVTHVKVPGTFNTSTEITLVKVAEVGKFVVERIDIHQEVYDHCSMRRD